MVDLESSSEIEIDEAGAPDPVTLGDDLLTCVIAHAGAGKTHLLHRWRDAATTNGRRAALVDGDSSQGRDDIAARCRSVIDSARPLQLLLLDHIERSSPSDVEDVISRCIYSGVQLVIASRRRIRHEAPTFRTIGPDELFLDRATARRLVHPPGIDIAGSDLDGLVERVERWPAGLRLASTVLASEANPSDTARSFSGRDRAVADYFETEVLSGVRPDDVSFLERISVLPFPEGDAADAVIGRPDSARRLVSLADAGVLVSRDRAGGFRWQPLARDYLAFRTSTADSDAVSRDAHRALGWYRSHERHDEAFALATELGDAEVLVDIVCESGLDAVASGRAQTVIGWLGALPSTAVERRPGIAVIAAAAHWVSQGDDAAAHIEDWLTFTQNSCSEQPPGSATSLTSAVDAARAVFGDGSGRERIAAAERAHEVEMPRRTPWAALAATALGRQCYLDERADDATQHLAAALSIFGELENTPERWSGRLLAAEAFGLLAMIEIDAGDVDRALINISSGELYLRGRSAHLATGGTLELAKARLFHRRGELMQAQCATSAVRLAARDDAIRVLVETEAASIFVALGDITAATASVELAEGHISASESPASLCVRRTASVRRLLEQATRAPADPDGDLLTEREAEVLRLLDTDLTRREIGERLYLAHNTVKTYVQRVYQKLGVSSRPAAVAAGRERGWL